MDLSNPMAEIKFSGSPIYMLKVRDLSDKGAGVIVKSDSSAYSGRSRPPIPIESGH